MRVSCFFGFHKWERIESESYGNHTIILKCPKCGSRVQFDYTDAGAQFVSGEVTWIKPKTPKQKAALRKYFKRILKRYKILDVAGLPKRDKNGFSYSLGNRKQRRATARGYNRFKKGLK